MTQDQVRQAAANQKHLFFPNTTFSGHLHPTIHPPYALPTALGLWARALLHVDMQGVPCRIMHKHKQDKWRDRRLARTTGMPRGSRFVHACELCTALRRTAPPAVQGHLRPLDKDLPGAAA